MITNKIVMEAPNGLHARPAGELVKLVKSYAPAKVTLHTSVKEVNAASMLGVLSLGLKKGSEIEICVDGGDESAILAGVSEFLLSIKD